MGGGPFMKGHRLTVMRIRGVKQRGGHNGAEVSVKCDGTEILQTTGDKFESSDGSVEGEHLQKIQVQEDTPEGKDFSALVKKWGIFRIGEWQPGHFVFRLPQGVEIYLARIDLLSIIIKMPKDANQDGLCGDFDGDDTNDDFKQVEARMGSPKVESGDNLFNMDYKDYDYR